MSDIDELIIRAERLEDIAAIAALNMAAFSAMDEAHLVDALREAGALTLSLVAELGSEIVGHIAFSAASVDGYPDLKVVGLAPMAVGPTYQCRGVGTALVEEGLDRLRGLGYELCVVVGHPAYYPRFGFESAVRYGLHWTQKVPDEVFMLLALQPGALSGVHGTVRYHPLIEGMGS